MKDKGKHLSAPTAVHDGGYFSCDAGTWIRSKQARRFRLLCLLLLDPDNTPTAGTGTT